MALHRLIYVSRATDGVRPQEVLRMVERAWHNNVARALTGVLCFDQGCFLQVLEGEPEVLNTLFFRIARDPRHRDVRILCAGPVEARHFRDWGMGFVSEGLGDLPERLRADAGYGPFPVDPDKALVFVHAVRTRAGRFDEAA